MKQIRRRLAVTGTRRQPAMPTPETLIYDDEPFVIIPVRRANPWGEHLQAFESSSPASHPAAT